MTLKAANAFSSHIAVPKKLLKPIRPTQPRLFAGQET
jgi:hypothetical protein